MIKLLKNKIVKATALLLVLCMFVFLIFMVKKIYFDYVIFTPVRFDGNKYAHYNLKINSEQKVRFIVVLAIHKVPVRLNVNREIMIPNRMYDNVGLMNEISQKALDPAWYNRHILLSSDSTKYAF